MEFVDKQVLRTSREGYPFRQGKRALALSILAANDSLVAQGDIKRVDCIGYVLLACRLSGREVALETRVDFSVVPVVA